MDNTKYELDASELELVSAGTGSNLPSEDEYKYVEAAINSSMLWAVVPQEIKTQILSAYKNLGLKAARSLGGKLLRKEKYPKAKEMLDMLK